MAGLDIRRLPVPVFDPPQRALSGGGVGGWGGGGRLSILMSFERYRTILPGFLSRALVNSRNVKMRRGLRSIPLVVVVFFQFYQVYSLWAPLHFKT